MKRCQTCGNTFPLDANFCPMDGGKLDVIQAPSATGSGLVGGRFQLGAKLGGGRTGDVFAAVDTSNGQPCVVKVVPESVVGKGEKAQRAERELKQLAKVASERIVRVLDAGAMPAGGAPGLFVAMEQAPGTRLDTVLASTGPLAPERVLAIAHEIAEGLAEAAKNGVIHRDVAPKNVLLLPGDKVKLLNFATPVPLNDKLAGTPEFLSPEQGEGKAPDQRSNIYGLGSLVYLMITGQPPFTGAPQAVVDAHLRTAPTPPSQRGAKLPEGMERALLKALEKSPSRRQLTLKQLVTELEAGAAPGSVSATQPAAAAAAKVDAAARTMFGYASPPPGSDKTEAMPASQIPGPPLVIVAPQPQAPQAPQPPVPQPPVVLAPVAAPAAPVVPVTPFQPAPHAAPHQPAPHAAPHQPAAPQMAQAPGQHAAHHGPGGAVAFTPAGAAPSVPAWSPPAAAMPTATTTGGGAGGKGKKAPEPAPAAKRGQFRETMWFKKGELDEAAAQAAAQIAKEGASPDGVPVSDKADELAIDERYKDDGSITAGDRQRLSLQTGHTQMMQAVQPTALPGERMGDDALIEEMQGGRKRTILLVVLGLLAMAAVVVYFTVFNTSDTPKAATPDAAAAVE